MPRYVKVALDPTYYHVNDDGTVTKMDTLEQVYERGLHPVETVSAAELEALIAAGGVKSADEEEE